MTVNIGRRIPCRVGTGKHIEASTKVTAFGVKLAKYYDSRHHFWC